MQNLPKISFSVSKNRLLCGRQIIFFLILIFALLLPDPVYSDTALPPAGIIKFIDSGKLYNDPMWIALLHYLKKVNGGYVSEADGKNFFISPYGKTNPREELLSDIAAFMEPEEKYSDEVMHPQCRFPARYKWIKTRLSESGFLFKDVKCNRFEEWAYLLRPRGMTLVYASGYLNNPASMFGHTFIRLDRKEKTIETDLLSYAINYAAIPTTSNAFFYAILGLTGGFEGRFSTLPYYMKVQEYGSMENRDLWEYQLNVNEEQIDYVVRHIWELGQTHFDYFYIDENCSYHILSLVQIAFPDIDFRDYFPVYTVPQDTIKFLLKYDSIIKGVTYRPSLKSIAENMVLSLNKEELGIAIRIAKSETKLIIPEGFDKLTDERKAAVLDIASVLYRFYRGYGLPEKEEKKVRETEKEILLNRAKLNIISHKTELSKPQPPHSAHGPAMLSIGGGISNKGSFETLELKPVLHDLISREDGYEPLTQIDMLKLSLRFNNRSEKVLIDSFDFIRIVSIAEMKSWLKKLSWNLSLGTDADYRNDIGGLKYINFMLRGGPGIGMSTHIFTRETYFLFWENRIIADTDPDITFCSGITGGLILKITDITDLIAGYSYCLNILSTKDARLNINDIYSEVAFHLSKDKDIRLKGKISDFDYFESFASFVLFF